MTQRRREGDQPQGHDHATLVHYLESIDHRCEAGFKAVDARLEDISRARASCKKEHDERMASIEHWRSWLLGAAAVVGLIASAVTFSLTTEISELRKLQPPRAARSP